MAGSHDVLSVPSQPASANTVGFTSSLRLGLITGFPLLRTIDVMIRPTWDKESAFAGSFLAHVVAVTVNSMLPRADHAYRTARTRHARQKFLC